ncbi:acyltransferase family protein [Nocardioides zeae]
MSQATTPRRDIQGLRAFAVTAVVLDHLLGWPHGGFVGVDVFFVISGFLITGILLREHERTGTISFVGFYRRRAKRILPASILVLAVTVALSYALVGRLRADSIATDGLWALFFGANWRFTTQATDYFAANGPVSPLQHYWSLAVEEQFYFVWPWLMLGVLALLAARTRRRAGTVTTSTPAPTTTASWSASSWPASCSPRSRGRCSRPRRRRRRRTSPPSPASGSSASAPSSRSRRRCARASPTRSGPCSRGAVCSG